MKSIYSVITRRFVTHSLVPILLVELSLIIALFMLNNYQSATSKEALHEMAHESFKEIATQTSGMITQRFAYDKSSLIQLKQSTEIFFDHLNDFSVYPNEWHNTNGFYQYNLNEKKANGFAPLKVSEKTSVYTTNLKSLDSEDYKILTALTMVLPSIRATVDTQNDLISAAWININKFYALAYPPIEPSRELEETLDVTAFPFYYLADPQHNPDKKAVFTPLYREEWAINAGEIGAYLAPIYKNERFLGVIGLTLTGKTVADVIKAMELPFGANALLVDSEERLIVSSDTKKTFSDFGVRSFYELFCNPEHKERNPGQIAFSEKMLEETILIKQSIPETDLQLIIYAGRGDVFETIDRISSHTLAVGIAFISAIAIFYFIFFYFSVRSMKRLAAMIASPLRSIVHFSSKLGRDEGVTLETSTIEELQELNTNLNLTHEKLLQMVIKDEDTGLYNRRKLLEELRDARAKSLMLIQLSNYKTLHNLYGPEAANALFFGVVEELKRAEKLQAFRIGDDEFALLNFTDDLTLFDKLFVAVSSREIPFHSVDIHPFIFAGIAENTTTDTPLIEQAGMALLYAQRNIASRPIRYKDALTIKKEFENNLGWSTRFNNALRQDRLIPYFQPIYNLRTGKVEKFESLVRMAEGAEVIPPGYFLQTAASMGKIHDITRMMIPKVLAVAADFQGFGFSINLSFKDFDDPHMLDFIHFQCKKYNVAPRRITFELLETDGVGEENGHIIEIISQLKHAGFTIAIDDFGTGHSNFAHLMMMQVDYIKIDGQFIKNIAKDPNSAMITKTIAKFASLVGAKTIAEFVADAAILKRVRQFNIDYVQGYTISEPLPAEAIEGFLIENGHL